MTFLVQWSSVIERIRIHEQLRSEIELSSESHSKRVFGVVLYLNSIILNFHQAKMKIFSARCTSLARLDGKTAVVTGCNTGIGKCTVEDFFLRGARVIMACRNLEKAEEAKNSIMENCKTKQNTGVIAVTELDLCSLNSIRNCAKQLLDTEKKNRSTHK
ncbi:hypothetical protein NQ315_010303 [Exocentrus adspersus]|uniref:Retinol dehydrogenase 11 n=1 Tax=Exocentrus adspersus TaxID=1586481 RepID=A0AAV8WC06_9CUCU|nr:hypothetical protein NQ315_010303 [Exocentrus adspersus]